MSASSPSRIDCIVFITSLTRTMKGLATIEWRDDDVASDRVRDCLRLLEHVHERVDGGVVAGQSRARARRVLGRVDDDHHRAPPELLAARLDRLDGSVAHHCQRVMRVTEGHLLVSHPSPLY